MIKTIVLLCSWILLTQCVHAFDVRVGVLNQVPLLQDADTSKKAMFLEGVAIDVIKAIAEKEKWAVEFYRYDQEEGLQALQQSQVDIFVGLPLSADPSPCSVTSLLKFSKQSILSRWGQFYSHGSTQIQTWSDLQGLRIAVVAGSVHNHQLEKQCKTLSLSCQLALYPDLVAVFDNLASGIVDAALLPRLDAYVYEQALRTGESQQADKIQRNALIFNPYGLYVVSSELQNGHIVDSIDRYLSHWKKQTDSPYQHILQRWLGGTGLPTPSDPVSIWHWLFHGLLLGLIAVLSYALLTRYRHQLPLKYDWEKLEQSENMYRSLVETMPYGLEEIDIEGVVLFSNHADQRIRRYSRQELLGHSILNMILSDKQRQLFKQFLDTLIKEKPTHPDPFYLTITRKDGLSADIRTDLSYKLDSRGEVTGFFLSITDVTGMKETKDRIKNYHLDLKKESQDRGKELQNAYNDLLITSAVFEHTAEAIMVLDIKGDFSAINPAFTKITGYQEEAVKGQPFSLIVSDRQQDTDYSEKLWKKLEKNPHWQGEIWSQRSDGNVYPAWVSINAVQDANEQITQYVALLSDITRRKQYEKQIWRQANYDALTTLPNRHLFHRRMQQALAKAEKEQHQIALMFIDLDHFKEVNDSMGHDAGDELLKAATQRIKAIVRPQDTVARMGGDEFTIIMPELHELNSPQETAKHILASLVRPFTLAEGNAAISASIGIVAYPEHGLTLNTLLKNADIAMYQVKDRGRNGYGLFKDQEKS